MADPSTLIKHLHVLLRKLQALRLSVQLDCSLLHAQQPHRMQCLEQTRADCFCVGV
jgi:hypothetical protein